MRIDLKLALKFLHIFEDRPYSEDVRKTKFNGMALTIHVITIMVCKSHDAIEDASYLFFFINT